MSRPWMLNFLKRWATASRPTSSGMPLKSHQTARHCCRNQPTAVLRPLYTSSCVSRHLQLRTGGFCWCKVLLPACLCWRQPAHSDSGEDAGVLVNGVIYAVSVPCCKLLLYWQQEAHGSTLPPTESGCEYWTHTTYSQYFTMGPVMPLKNGASSGGPGSSPVTRFLNSTLTWLTEWWF